MARFNCSMVSYTLDRAIDLTVIIPTPTYPDIATARGNKELIKHTPKEKYPVLYLLHGYSGSHTSWTSYANTEMYAEERKIAVVMLSAENKRYVDKNDDNFFTFLSEELPDFITGMFPVSKRPEDTYIAGLSMGGYGTVIHALNHPEKFAAMGSFSGAVLLKDENKKAYEEKFDPAIVAYKLFAAKATLPKMYISCGEKDFLFETNKEFKKLFEDNGYELTWVTDPRYGHEWRFWDEQIEAFLDWIPRTDPYKDIRTGV